MKHKKAGKRLLEPRRIEAARRIVSTVADAYGHPIADLQGNDRRGTLVEARRLSIYLLRTVGGVTTTDAALIFRRRHCAAITSTRKIEDRIATDPAFARKVEGIKQALAAMKGGEA